MRIARPGIESGSGIRSAGTRLRRYKTPECQLGGLDHRVEPLLPDVILDRSPPPSVGVRTNLHPGDADITRQELAVLTVRGLVEVAAEPHRAAATIPALPEGVTDW